MSGNAVKLLGGNINAAVVRVDSTVRRQLTSNSATIHQLLLHLEKKGFTGSPRFLGIDEQGREILTFLEGDTGIPTYIWQCDEPLIAAARLLRQYHDSTVDFEQPKSSNWAYMYPDDKRHEVICHNDFAPYNMVFAAGVPYGIIDFDLAGPGPRLRDVAYAAYWMTPMSLNSTDQIAFAEVDIANESRRCRLFCEIYGIPVDVALFDMIAEFLTFMGNEKEMCQVVGKAATEKLKREGHLAHWQREESAFQLARSRFEDNLLR
jgi:hypothetical protein